MKPNNKRNIKAKQESILDLYVPKFNAKKHN